MALVLFASSLPAAPAQKEFGYMECKAAGSTVEYCRRYVEPNKLRKQTDGRPVTEQNAKNAKNAKKP